MEKVELRKSLSAQNIWIGRMRIDPIDPYTNTRLEGRRFTHSPKSNESHNIVTKDETQSRVEERRFFFKDKMGREQS